jgi:5-methyltetrahydropteroyltriglutamate--homocysteine methyltransferase
MQEVVGDQTGLDIITDGMLTWDDYLASIASNWAGIKMGGLIRFYDNNTYYRRPTIVGDISNAKPLLKENLALLKKLNPGSKTKAVVPGPYSLFMLSEDKFYNDDEACIKALSKALEAEIRTLDADYIQIDEPSLSYEIDRDLFPLVNSELKKLAKAAKGKVIISSYFGDLRTCMKEIIELKANYIGIDCVSFESNYETLIQSGIKNVQLGILDARNTKIEDGVLLKDRIEMLDSDDIIISTNCGLEFLPRKYAMRKLDLLKTVAAEE